MYIELHASSAFSFLEGASLPEQLAETAASLEYPALALLDRDGVYGAPRFHRAARQKGILPLVGSEITLQDDTRLPLLVENQTGYRNLCRMLTQSKLRTEKGGARVGWLDLEPFHDGLVCLTGGEQGPLRTRLRRQGLAAARDFLDRLAAVFGRNNVYVELQRHFLREEEAHNQALASLAAAAGLPLLATNGVLYDHPRRRDLFDVLTCIRHRTTLERAGRLLQRNAERFLKPPRQMERLFSEFPGAAARSAELASRLTFTLEDLGYRFPHYPVPPGETMQTFLRSLTRLGGRRHYGEQDMRAWGQIERELALIEKLDLAGYFLIVWDIVRFCREEGILVQGRGSAANSAVCYSLGITAVDPVRMDLLFERFLSEERGEWPDIDLDLPSGEDRERVIQYVYRRYGRQGAGMTANVITYRDRSAAREVGKVFSFPPELLSRLSGLLSRWGYAGDPPALLERLAQAGADAADPATARFAGIWESIQDLPRHLGQHSGGMVICRDALDTVVPLENARMPGRVVVQWDKDDCADMGIIKVDLLGLGMMSALQDSIRIISSAHGERVDLAHLPADDPEVYRLLQEADTVGLFQVESRAQMATLPRLRPRCFYDLVVQVAIIRPGPIVGNMVHPYLNRRAGREPVRYPHPSLEPVLKRTLGVPLFQEQLLRIAMIAGGFTGGEAEELRRALGFKRSETRMRAVAEKLRAGMARNGITGEAAETILRSLAAFALYGFPESHAASFALLAYASAYLKVHYPAAFYASLLNSQPMGFYSPATLVQDARRRGQRIRPVDVCRSEWDCTVEPDRSLRLGLRLVRGLRREAAAGIVGERAARPFDSLEDFSQRTGLTRAELTTLAEIGALNGFGLRRRSALWQAAAIGRPVGPLLARSRAVRASGPAAGRSTARGVSAVDADTASEGQAGESRDPEAPPPAPLADMTAEERLAADYRGTGVTLGPHPVALCRRRLEALGVLTAAALGSLPHGRRVRIGGMVITRQRPATAKGFFFITLEDETGVSNAIVRPALFERQRDLLVSSTGLIIEGVLQHADGVVSVRAHRIHPWLLQHAAPRSHDFH